MTLYHVNQYCTAYLYLVGVLSYMVLNGIGGGLLTGCGLHGTVLFPCFLNRSVVCFEINFV